MKYLLILLVFFSSLSVSLADDRFELLKSQRATAVERAVTPINDRYVVELKKLLKILTTAGDLDTALEVREEINKFGNAPVKQALNPPQKRKGFSEIILNGTEWGKLGAEEGKSVVWKFDKTNLIVLFKDDKGKLYANAGNKKPYEIVNIESRTFEVTWAGGRLQRFTLNEELTEISEENGGVWAKLIED